MTSQIHTPREPMVIRDFFQCAELNRLFDEKRLNENERNSYSIISVQDDSMARQIMVGGAIVLHQQPISHLLGSCVGKPVALRSVHHPDTYILGRLQSVSNRYVRLSRDNPAFQPVTLSRASILQAYQIVYLLYMPLDEL
ncbi:hypothetical protein [Spirosoma koreense]